MGDLIQKTSLLEDNIKKLLALHQGQKAKIHSLEAENKQFKVTIQEQQEQIRQLQDGKLAQHIAHNLKTNQPGKDSNEIRNEITRMIREIDQCIASISE